MARSFSLSKGVRQPAQQLWSLEHLVYECSIALSFAIDTGTAHTYSSALNSYIVFCQLHHFPIQLTEDTLSFFIIYMSYHIKLKSIDSYLSGICNQLEHYFPNVCAVHKSLLVKWTLKGCMWLHGTAVKQKLPLSWPQLQKVLDKFNPSTDYDDLPFVSMIITGFYGILCFAEVSMPDSKELCDWKKFTHWRSIHMDKDITPFGCQLTKQILLLRETRSSLSTEMLLTHMYLSSNTSHLRTDIFPFICYCGHVATATALCKDGSFTNSGQFSLTSILQDNQCELAVLLLWPKMVLFRISFKQQAIGHLMHSKFTSARTLYFCRQSFSPERRLPGPYNPSDPSSFVSWSFPSSISSPYLTYITLSSSLPS